MTVTERDQGIIRSAVAATSKHGGESVRPGFKDGRLVALIIHARGRYANVYVNAEDDADTVSAEIAGLLAPPLSMS